MSVILKGDTDGPGNRCQEKLKLGQNSCQKIEVDIAARDHEANAAGARRQFAGEGGGDGDGAGGFGNQLQTRGEEADGGDNLLFRNGENAIDPLLHQGEGKRAGRGRAQTVGDGEGVIDADTLPLGEGEGKIIGKFGFNAEDAEFGMERFGGNGTATEEASAADADQERIQVWDLGEPFEGGSSLPGYGPGMIKGVDEGGAGFGLNGAGDLFAVLREAVEEDDVSAAVLRGEELGLGGVIGHDDGGGDAHGFGGPGDGLRMVTGADGDDAFGAIGFRDLAEEVRGAADFEGARGLEVFALEEAGGTGKTVQPATGGDRRGFGEALDAGMSGLDVGQGGRGKRGLSGHLGQLSASGDDFGVQILAQDFGNDDGAVFLLVVFDDGDPGAADSQAAAV